MSEFQHEVVQNNPDLSFKLKLFAKSVIESPPHWHNCFEIMHVFGGALRVVLKDKSFIMRRGDIIFINSEDVHATHTLEWLDASLIQIPYEVIKTIAPDIETLYFDFNTAAMSPGRRRGQGEFAETLVELYDVYQAKNDGYGFKVISLLCDFLYRLFRSGASRHKTAKRKTDKYLHRLGTVTSFILENYRTPINVKQLSSIAYLNPEYFSRFFKKYMGMTPMDYLHLIRVQNIAADLRSTDRSVNDLAAMHGCNDYKLFLRRFRSVYGCTPSQYRREPPPTVSGQARLITIPDR